MKATIVNIGDELLIGQVVNTNATQMAHLLVGAGIAVGATEVIGDNQHDITDCLARALQSSQIVLITGGLGPTKDDITKKTLCQFFHSELYENPEALANIQRIFTARGYELTPVNRQQAWVPRCCTMINNILGTAPCMWFEVPSRLPGQPPSVVVSLPGVPFEMLNLMETEIVPRLQRHFRTGQILTKTCLCRA